MNCCSLHKYEKVSKISILFPFNAWSPVQSSRVAKTYEPNSSANNKVRWVYSLLHPYSSYINIVRNKKQEEEYISEIFYTAV